MRSINLASQPFRNQKLPALLLGVAAMALALLTVQHALVVRRLLPRSTSTLHREVAELEREAGRLRSEGRGLRAPKPEAGTLAEWVMLKDLVDQRTFSWTSLFSVLEQIIPDGVRLISITPEVRKGVMGLDLEAVARSYQEGIEFLRVLEQRPEFADVYPLSRSDEEATTFRYRVTYHPAPAVAAAPEPAPASDPAEAGPSPAAAPDRAASSQ